MQDSRSHQCDEVEDVIKDIEACLVFLSRWLIEEEERDREIQECVAEVEFQCVMNGAWGAIEDDDVDEHQDAEIDVLAELESVFLGRGHVGLAAIFLSGVKLGEKDDEFKGDADEYGREVADEQEVDQPIGRGDVGESDDDGVRDGGKGKQ